MLGLGCFKALLVKQVAAVSSFKQIVVRCSSTVLDTSSQAVDTLIIGGGPIGLSCAFHLATLRDDTKGSPKEIVVLEQDPTYKSSSAMASAGGIRQQFSLEENIRMSLYGRDFLRNANSLLATPSRPHVDVQFQEYGYLFLAATPSGVAQMQENHRVQRKAGCTAIELLKPTELKQKFPWLNSEDILLGSYGTSGEGWFDPWVLIQGLKEKAKETSVEYVHALILEATRDEETGRVQSILVQDQKTGELRTYCPNHVVNATGARAESTMNQLAGNGPVLFRPLPVKPRKRCIFFFHCALSQDLLVPQVAPLTVDPSMVYFRTEGAPGAGTFICGVSPPEDEDIDSWDPDDLEFQNFELFEHTIWPALAHRVPAFGAIKVQSSWSGLYEYNTVDQNAIIDYHPEMPNVLMVNGFSGHGLQHSPAAGRAAAELIEHGHFTTLDLRIFNFNRFINGSPVFEKGIV